MPKERSGRFRRIRRIRVPTVNLDAQVPNASRRNEHGEPSIGSPWAS
jgi:hypothetical protein